MKTSLSDHQLIRKKNLRKRFCDSTAVALGTATAVVGMLGVSAPVSAQQLEEVVVTARYREESLQEAPIAITAVTGETLDIRGLESLEDVGAVVPNAYFRRQGTQVGPTPAVGLRGVVTTDFSFANEPAVAVYIDDAYHGTLLGSSMELMDLQRIEVLRGPQGTLFGKNAMGGAIRAVSKKPQGDNTGFAQVTYGDYDRLDVKAGFDTALIEDKLFLRATGLSNHREGFQEIHDFTCTMVNAGTPELAGIGDGIGAPGTGTDIDINGDGIIGDVDLNNDGMPEFSELDPRIPDSVPISTAVGSADRNYSLPSSRPGISNGGRDCQVGTAGGVRVQAARVMLRWLASDTFEANFAFDYTDDTSDPQADDMFFLPNGTNLTPYNLAVIGPPPRGTSMANLPNYLPSQYFQLADGYNATTPPSGIYRTYTDANYGIPFDGRFLTGDPYKTYSTFDDPVNNESFPPESAIEAKGVSAVLDWDFGEELQVKWVLSKREYLSEFSDDRDHSPLGVQLVWTLAEHDQFSTEVQFSGLLGENLDWTAGLFYYDAETFWGGAPRLLDSGLGGFTHNDTADTENKSAFVHAVYSFSDNFSATIGLRWSDESKDYHFDHTPAVNPPDDAGTSNDRMDWKFGLDYQVNDDVLAYFQASTGARSETFNVRLFTINQLQEVIPEEEQTAYEVGIKGDFLDNTLRLNMAAFYSDWNSRNIPRSATECLGFPHPFFNAFLGAGPCPGGVPNIPWFATINTDATVTGFELELQSSPIDGLNIDATLGWNKFKADDVNSDILLQPEINMSAGIQYDFQLAGGASLIPRLDIFYQGEAQPAPGSLSAAPTDFDTIDAHAWMNGRITYRPESEDWSLAFLVTNLTDKFYYETYFGSGADFRTGAPAKPREWALTFRKEFN